MKNFMNSARNKLDKLKDSTFNVKLDGNKLTRLAINNIPPDKNIVIENITVSGNVINVSGKAMRYKMNHSFTLTVEPDGITDREISFKLLHVKPVHNKWLNNKVFTDISPYVLYDNSRFTIELNKIANVKNYPLGKIKNSTIEDDKYVIGLGI